MRVYLQPPQPSRGLDRIAHALRRYAPPWVEVCEFPRNVDLTVIYAIGRRDGVLRQVREIQRLGRQYAIIQVCLRSTMSPRTEDWQELWFHARAVWSYYDLEQATKDDGGYPGILPNFYHAPLGADASTFYPRDTKKYFIAATTGLSRLSESVREVALAAKVVNRRMFHLGPTVLKDDYVTCLNGISDDALAYMYSQSEFVSGLRRKEGFELPAVEGLLCGARPILFNSRDYRTWYEPWGEFIEETDRQGVVDQLVELFKRGARPVTDEERQRAVERFNWETIIGGFYERLR